MALTFAELSKLERLLIEEGAKCDASTELNATAEWLKDGSFGTHLEEALTRLAETAQQADNKTAAKIALGSLVFARREFDHDEGRCLAVLRFATQRVGSIESDNVYWANVVLSANDEEDARALFEAAIGDRSYSTRELIETANDFANRHEGEHSVFGRLAADLALLVTVIESEESQEHKEVARAALLYFAEKADAIPDDVGLVGLLDDAYIVQQAVGHICPDKASLTAYLENCVKRWPFLRNLRFDTDNKPTLISDYLLANSALLMDTLESEGKSTIVFIDDVGPLPYLLGIVAVLAQISEMTDTGGAVLKYGDRLMDRDGTGEVVFNRYYRQEGADLVICDAQLATHAQVIQPARGRTTEVLRTIPVAELGNFRRTATGVDKRRRNVVKVDISGRKAGSLELLFGTTTPIMLDPQSPIVLVVAPIQKTKHIAENLKLFGTLARDVVPSGHLHRTQDGLEVEYWSKHGIGGEPMLYVVRSVDEAYEAVVSPPFEHRRVSTVISAVRPNSPDASQLVRIHDSSVSVIAFVAPEDPDAPEIFADHGMSFWSWDADWLGQLYWPQVKALMQQPIVAYEHDLRQRLRATNHVETVRFDELSELAAVLVAMDRGHDADNEPLAEWVNMSWWLLLHFCRWLTPVEQDIYDQFTAAIGKLAALRHRNQYRWSENDLNTGEKIIKLFEQVLKAISNGNSKYEQLLSLALDSPGSIVLVAERDRARVSEALSSTDAHVISRNLSEEDGKFRIIPAWYSQSQMQRLIFASRFERQTLLLYEPEVEWFGRAQQRRERAIIKTQELVGRCSAIPLERREEAHPRPTLPDSNRFGDVDEVLKKSISRFVERSRHNVDDRVNATVVGFVGGSWAAFTPAHRIVLVSDLVEDHESGTDITSAIVSDLESGDIVLLLRESDRDAIRERASLSLSEHMIHMADAWKRALQTYVNMHPDLEELRHKLKRAGCEKTVQTIRAWISDDYVIGPQYAESVLPAITEVTSSAELRECEQKCLIAIRSVRSAHVSAGKWLAKQVIKRAREWADAGAMPDDLVDLENRLVLATVDFVDATQKEVPTNLVNRLQSSTWRL